MHFYRETLKKAWQFTIQNPFLWFFGLFAALAGNGEEYDTFFSNLKFVHNTQLNLDGIRDAQLAGQFGEAWHNLGAAFGNSAGALIVILLIGLLILFLFAWLVTVSQAAIVSSASRREDGQPISWLEALSTGVHKFWPLLLLNVIALAVVYIPLGLLAIPFVVLYVKTTSLVWSVIMTLIAFLILVPVNVIVSFLAKYATAYIVIRGSRVWPAIRDSWRLFKKNWLISLELGIILLVINVVYTVIVVSILTMLGLPLSRVGLISFTVVVIALGSIYSVFRYGAWTFLFRALVEDRVVSKLVRLFHSKAVGEVK